MSIARDYLDGALAIVKRDALIYLSYRARWVSQIFTGLFSVTLFYYLSRLVKVPAFGDPDAYFAFAVVGLIINQVLQSTLGISDGLRAELLAGTFERLVVSPFGPVAGVVSMVLFPLIESLLLATLLLAISGVIFGLPIHWSTVPLVIPIAVIGSLAFGCFGMLFAAAVIVVKQAAVGANWLMAGIALVAGLYFPISLLPGWIRWASEVQPFTPAVDLLRNVIVGTPLHGSAWADVAKLVGFAVVLAPLAVVALKVALSTGRRRATLIEY